MGLPRFARNDNRKRLPRFARNDTKEMFPNYWVRTPSPSFKKEHLYCFDLDSLFWYKINPSEAKKWRHYQSLRSRRRFTLFRKRT